MSDDEAKMVPFSSDWRVIMRKPDSSQVVVYNEKLHQIELHSSATSQPIVEFDSGKNINICSLCKRPFEYYDPVTGSIIDNGYFKLLGSMLTKYYKFRDKNVFLSFTAREHPETAEEKWCAKNLPETAFNQGYYRRFFKEGRRLGRGARGSVFICQHIIDNVPLGEYAVKIVPIGDDKSWLLRHLKEVHTLERLRHPNIIEYKHTWIEYHKSSKFGPTVPCLFILMEFANSGNLEDFMELELIDDEEPKRGRNKPKAQIYLDEADVLKIFLEAAKGLQHLHSLGILHRDMKPANLLLNYPRDSATKPNILLSDFGECSEIEHESSERSGATGTIEFMAPELFQTDENGILVYNHSFATDTWSLGMILFYLYFGRLPYSQVEDVDELKYEMLNIKSIDVPELLRDISAPMTQLIKHMLSLNPDQRPVLKEIVKAVEGMLVLRASPKMTTSFSSPMMRAITSEPVILVNPYTNLDFITAYFDTKLVGFAIVFVSALLQMRVCYPYLPAFKILGLYTVFVVFMIRSNSRITLLACAILSLATLIYSRFTGLCAC